MNIRIKYFGQVAELVGKEEETKDLAAGSTLNDLELEMCSNYKVRNTYYRIALNQTIQENKEVALNTNDEVAFMPPFAGG